MCRYPSICACQDVCNLLIVFLQVSLQISLEEIMIKMKLNVYKKQSCVKRRSPSGWEICSIGWWLLKWWLHLALQGSMTCSWLMVMCFTSLYLHTELLLRKCQRIQLAKLWHQGLNVNVGIFFLLFPNSPRCCKQPTQKSCPEPGLFGRCYFS